MALMFEWDPIKARTNLQKHGVSFSEAASAFMDQLSVTIPNPTHSDDEERFLLLGLSDVERLLIVVHTIRGETIRIISARTANRRERSQYEQEQA
jgi:uncharacterized DUF497 family protein